MGVRIKLSFPALRLGKTSFWRCGVEHGRDGAVYAEDQFTPAEWDRLRSDPMLEVTVVPDDVPPAPTPEEAAAALRLRVRSVIEGLTADEFTKGGAPQLGAIRAAIPEAGSELLKPMLLEVWAEMVTAGFKRPAPAAQADTDTAPVPGDTEPAPSAGAAQDDAGAPEEA